MNKTICFILLFLLSTILFGENAKHYEVKSGMFTMKMSNSFLNSTTVHYFDDYGKKNRSEIKNNITANGMNTITTMILVMNGDKVWSLFPETNSYMSFNIDDEDNDDDESMETVDSSELKDEKPIREEKIIGKNCKVFQLKDKETLTTIWMWKGFVLKQIIESQGMKTITEVTKIKLNKSVDSDLFEIPASYTEKKNPMNDLFKGLNQSMKRQEAEEAEERKRKRFNQEENKAEDCVEEDCMQEDCVEAPDDSENTNKNKDTDEDIDKAAELLKSFF